MNTPNTEDRRLDEIADSYDSHLAEQEEAHFKQLDAEERERAETDEHVA